jgi:ABC-type nickel/cobalt efflux system permease component RcnA
MSRRALVALGFAGGLVPSPSAVVVLLGASALGHAWFGVLLVVAYGAGMAATLTGLGLFLLRARRSVDRRVALRRPGWAALADRLLPLATASLIVAAGLLVAAQGAAAL